MVILIKSDFVQLDINLRTVEIVFFCTSIHNIDKFLLLLKILEKNTIFRDRKLKKFVGGNGDDSKKKIRTEEGTYLPTTYKSGRYERWQKKQKLEYQKNEDEETTDTGIKQYNFKVHYLEISINVSLFEQSSY